MATPDLSAALEQLGAAREGQSRTEQYVVKEHAKIVEEVDEEEYRKIVEQRREDFVVGEHSLGYADGGKELWEDPERIKDFQRRQQRPAADAKSSPSKPVPAAAAPKEPERPRANLLNAFQAGARPGTGRAEPQPAPGRDAHHQKDLDDMLNMFCSQIEAGDSAPQPVATPMAAERAGPKGGPAKRKLEGSGAGRANKKPPSGKVVNAVVQQDVEEEVKDSENMPPPVPVKKEIKEDSTMAPKLVAVKRELPDTQEVSNGVTTPDKPVKNERKIKIEAGTVRVKREAVDTSPGANGSDQLREWLQGGSCEGVKIDLEAATNEAETPAASKFQLHLEKDGGMWFFFIDAFEDDRATPPRVYLFGKVRVASAAPGPAVYQSCCLVVENAERCVHLLLNVPDAEDEAAAKQVAQEAEAEFDSICRMQCPGVRKLRSKLKWRNYAFEKALPQGAGYLPCLKVVCDAAGQMPPSGIQGRAFSHVFGAQSSMLERLLLTRRIQGPSWVRLHPGSWAEDPARLSFCAIELRITAGSIQAPKRDEDRKLLQEMGMPSDSPPLRVLSLSMQTFQRSPQEPHEPVAIVCTLHPGVSSEATDSDKELKVGWSTWSAVRRYDARALPRDCDQVLGRHKVQAFNSEPALFNAFLAKIQEFEPDVIVGYNAYGFDLDVLASRMQFLRLQTWQKLGRLRRPRERMPRVEGRQGAGFWVGNNLTAGRLVCDVLLQARDLLPKLGTYDLATLARHQLGLGKWDAVEPENLPRFFDSAQELLRLVDVTFNSALCTVRLMHSLQLLPLTRQLTSLAGNLWNSSLQNKRAERNEMLLCHEFHRKKFVLPDRESFLSRKRRMAGAGLDDAEEAEPVQEQGAPRRGKAAYSGGLVLEPKVGMYEDFVMLLDFNSLYPSIIQEHNICFTTVDRPDEGQVAKCTTEAALLAQTQLPDGTVEEGVLPQVLRRLVESRRNVKAAMKSEKDPRRKQTLEIRQLALKLTANSMYGCLGFQNSRFYAKPLAALITAKGREALQSTITVVEQELQLDVVYGDTDSVFVNTKTSDYEQAMQAAQQIKRSVNKRYKRLEIEVDGVFARLMLMKKKKYAALKVVDWEKQLWEREFKGLDIVRRDWCGIAKEVGEQILMKVLSSEGKEEAVNWAHSLLSQKAQEMDDHKVPLERYVITKGLTKDPKDYPDAKNQPHVQVALRMMERGKPVRAGEEVAYVICDVLGEGTKGSLAERARHPHEFQLDTSLRVDIAWYKKQQVHPLVSRLLAPVEGTDAARIAECLGMDASRFAQAAAAKAAADGNEDAAYIEAAAADVNALFDRKTRWKEFQSSLAGVTCTKCQKVVAWKQLLQPQAWDAEAVNSLFRCAECSEPVNPRRAQNLLTMQLRKMLKDHCEGWVQCPDENYIEKTRRISRGTNLTSERVVLKELEYIEYLCEAEEGYSGQDRRGCREAAKGMARTTRGLLEHNNYNWVNCGQIFSSIFGKK